jgi:hypothetical protein
MSSIRIAQIVRAGAAGLAAGGARASSITPLAAKAVDDHPPGEMRGFGNGNGEQPRRRCYAKVTIGPLRHKRQLGRHQQHVR